MNDDKREFLTVEQAVAMLPDDDTIHTFVQGGFCLIGADWDKQDVIKLLESAPESGIELAGSVAAAMGHKIACYRQSGYVFIETREDE